MRLPFLSGALRARLFGLLLLLVWLILFGQAAPASTLHLASYDEAPRFFLAVSKASQTLYVLQHKSPVQALQEYACSTGDQPGNKLTEGDERTPEGIYFLEDVRTSGLDYELYGDLAYTLNYPNPVDRIRGKTGYGIWIHGRGRELVPRDTKGCIALESRNIRSLSEEISLHLTPVIIGSKTDFSASGQNVAEIASRLSRRVQAWASAWEKRSPEYFAFYDPDSYTLASASPFEHFRARKERLFDSYPWIDIYLDEVRVLAGPDYWVTYFGQYFRSPRYVSEGVKRIYWQHGDSGWRIVGEEWRDKRLGLERGYLEQASKRIQAWLDKWRSAWIDADIGEYLAFYQPGARQQGRHGLQAIAEYKRGLWQQEEPLGIDFEGISVSLHRDGFQVSFAQEYRGTKGYSDYGRKTLILRPVADGFRILKEQWTAVSPS